MAGDLMLMLQNKNGRDDVDANRWANFQRAPR
jgi:hypothetical protein